MMLAKAGTENKQKSTEVAKEIQENIWRWQWLEKSEGKPRVLAMNEIPIQCSDN